MEDAIDAYKNALSANYAEAYNNVGIAYEQGKLERAIEAYNNALKPDNVEAFKNIGIALRLVEFAAPHPELQNQLDYYLIKRNLSAQRK